MDFLFNLYFGLLIFFAGASLGSFTECVCDRYSESRKMNLLSRSRCDVCGHTLGPLELVPVISYLLLRGSCRHCKVKIPLRCFITELLSGFYALALFIQYGISLRFFACIIIYYLVLSAAIIDIRLRIIPNIIPISLFVLRIIIFLLEGISLFSVINAASGSLIIALILFASSRVIRKKCGHTAIGGGDIKLLLAAGLFLGAFGCLLCALIMSVSGLLYVCIKKIKANEPFAFAPFIAFAVSAVLITRDSLSSIYFNVF